MVVFGRELIDPSFSVRRVDERIDLLSLVSVLRSEFEDVAFLESVEGPSPLAEYSFLAFDPVAVLEVPEGMDRSRLYVDGDLVEEFDEPLGHLRDLIGRGLPAAATPRLAGGAIGFVSYDAARMWHEFHGRSDVMSGFPAMRFGVFRSIVVHDHRTRETYVCSVGPEGPGPELQRALKEARRPDALDGEGFRHEETGTSLSEAEFVEAVVAAKEYISSGDVFQVVLSRRVDLRVSGDLMRVYAALRRINPSPYMFLLRLGDVELVGSSPEMLVRVEGDRVTTFPIAGTRRRLEDPMADSASDMQLLSDQKELAEHVMLVDLARNDLGRVCRPGTVNVAEAMRLVKYSHVKHLVSRVEGSLRQGLDSLDAFVSVFPAGTVSGAPKLRAMEVIDELEPVARGPYAGAVGYVSFNWSADFAIAIRTLFRMRDQAFIQAGAGVVWDSVPEREYAETEAKLSALRAALMEAEGA
ncbi:MAG: chorismate-binding protein [Thaumarchaeota archaeon]|nr:chorismate-binding protein [Candidatus Calditenuaceae archaeon]MCX8203012.1 chorismate-binding protein [Nitrososphaeria archaeon]MDW8043216.1 chorismate-binding protein [Nitrososphaerota archaeon]